MVEKTDACWLWKGRVERNGYARTLTGAGSAKTRWGAHRFAWTITYGPIPAGRHVLHRCDVRRCVRPDHLFLGDHPANMADMVSKGRSCRGRKNWEAKLSDDAVRIARLFRGLRPQREVALALGVSQPIISKIQRGELWTHVA